MVIETLGLKLTALRAMKSWSQEEASEACDISKRYYQSLESGKKWPTNFTVDKIIKGFGITDAEFFGSPESPLLESILAKFSELNSAMKLLRNSKAEGLTPLHLDLIEAIKYIPVNNLKVVASTIQGLAELSPRRHRGKANG